MVLVVQNNKLLPLYYTFPTKDHCKRSLCSLVQLFGCPKISFCASNSRKHSPETACQHSVCFLSSDNATTSITVSTFGISSLIHVCLVLMNMISALGFESLKQRWKERDAFASGFWGFRESMEILDTRWQVWKVHETLPRAFQADHFGSFLAERIHEGGIMGGRSTAFDATP